MKILTVRLFTACLLACLALGIQAAEIGEPQQVIKSTSERLKQVLEEDRQRLLDDPAYVYRMADEIFLPHVDMYRVSSLVLGRNWRKASADQKAAFSREFKRLLVRTYATAMRELGDFEIRFQPGRTQSDQRRALVKTEVLRPGAPPVAVDYQMHHSKGRWLAYDVKIEGISLVTNYRSSFGRLIRQKGIDGLIQELATMNQAREPAKSEKVAANNEH